MAQAHSRNTTPRYARLARLARVVAGLLAAATAGCSQSTFRPQAAVPLQETPAQRDARMQWWREARFGMFIHWGPVSLKGTEIGWSRGGERRGTGDTGEIPLDVYDNLYKQFNPVRFNADEWVRIAKDAGMKYLVFTTKHHDGFVEFDSKLTDYKITSPKSPYRRDIVRQLADACHRGGLRLGFYYSPPDWHHPDYRTAKHKRYIKYLHGQLRELCTNYGKVDIIWFDGLGGTADDWDAPSLLAEIRRLQPGIIINNRAGTPADFDTPEQRIGAFQNDRYWETCMTIGDQWAWKPDDNVKSTKQCIQTLVRVVGGDGNFLFNVGPMPDGRIEPRQVERLREMGQWLRTYGESVYATRGGPFKWNLCGAAPFVSTYRDNRVFVHILEWRKDSLSLPPIARKIVSSSVLTGGDGDVRQTPEGITVAVPPQYRQDIDTIVALELDGPAGDIAPVGVSSGSLARAGKAAASNVHQNENTYGADKAFDDDNATRWATDAGTHQAWIEVELVTRQTVDHAVMCEACGKRVQEYEFQALVGGDWKTLCRGTEIGDCATLNFEPATAQKFRLNILKASEGPTIWEIQLFGPN
jgi:alpha-L-fucosidase